MPDFVGTVDELVTAWVEDQQRALEKIFPKIDKGTIEGLDASTLEILDAYVSIQAAFMNNFKLYNNPLYCDGDRPTAEEKSRHTFLTNCGPTYLTNARRALTTAKAAIEGSHTGAASSAALPMAATAIASTPVTSSTDHSSKACDSKTCG